MNNRFYRTVFVFFVVGVMKHPQGIQDHQFTKASIPVASIPVLHPRRENSWLCIFWCQNLMSNKLRKIYSVVLAVSEEWMQQRWDTIIASNPIVCGREVIQ